MSEDPSSTLSHDTAFDLLSNARRRFVLRRLQEAGEGVELGDLATELSAVENDVPRDDLSSKQRKRTYVSLYQTHIPKLEEAGVVSYNSDSGVVRPTERLDELALYFDGPRETNWRMVYLSVCGVGLLLYAVAYAIELRGLQPEYVGLAVLAAVGTVSIGHYAATRLRGRRRATIPLERE